VAEIDDFIKTAEDRIFEELELNLFKKEDSSLSFTAGTATVVAPEDYLVSVSMHVTLGNGEEVPLIKKHHTFLDEYTRDPTDLSLRDVPKYYADKDAELYTSSSSGSTIQVSPVPKDALGYRLVYYFKPASITDVDVTRVVTLGTDPFATQGTLPSSVLTVTDTSHGMDEQTLVEFAGSAAVDTVAAAVINATLPHQLTSVATNSYNVKLRSTDYTTPVQSGAENTSTSGGSTAVVATYIKGAISWISTNCESALFYGCMVEAAIFMKQDAAEGSLLALMEARYQAQIARLKVKYQGRGRLEERRYDNARMEPA
jgi:hypothetical protein